MAQTDAGRPNYTDGDWALLPEWCIDTQDGPYGSPSYGDGSIVGRSRSPRSDRWTSIFGRDFWALHHLCRGLYAERRRLLATTPRERATASLVAISEYRYLVKACSPTMLLMPEIYYRLGENLLREGQKVQASEAFAEARRLKPDYWPAYASWADELASLGLVAQAIELLEEGLKHAPDQAQLRTRVERLKHARPGARPERRQ